MTESEWDIDVPEETSTPTGPKALRDAYERQREEAARLSKELAGLQAKVRAQEVSSMLAAKGLPDKAAKLFPKDLEPTEDEVTKWVEEYGSLFAPPSEKTAEDIPTPTPDTPKADVEQLQAIQQVTSGGVGGSSNEDFAAMLANPNLEREVPFEAFLEALKRQGAKV